MFVYLFIYCLLVYLEKSLPTRNVVYKHTCSSPNSHSFAFTWLPPTDNSNPTQYQVSISCSLSPSETVSSSVTVTQPLAEVALSATFDRFTQCGYQVIPLPEGPIVSDTLSDLSFSKFVVVVIVVIIIIYLFIYYLFFIIIFVVVVVFVIVIVIIVVLDNLESAEFLIRITNQSLIFVEISSITMCLSDLHGNTQIFDTRITLWDASTNQVAAFDASYANYYDTQTGTLSLVGFSSSSTSLVPGTNYSLRIQFPVNVNLITYPWYNHALSK